MPDTATRLPCARTLRNPVWLDAIDVYKRSFDATSAETLIDGAAAFAEMSPDDQAFHQAHLTFRQLFQSGSGLGDIHAALRRIDARLAGLGPEALAGIKDLPTMKKALVSIARGQNEMLRIVAQGGLSDAVNGDDDDDDSDDIVGEEDAEVIEDEDHGNGDAAVAMVPEVLPAGARRPPVETP